MNPEVGPASVGARRASLVQSRAIRRGIAIGLGTLLVALSAQVVVPVPFSPVPMTLQPLAVLAVGGFLGAVGGFTALLLYLILPTGGYLLAFPIAAAVTGALAGRVPGSVLRVLLACALGMVIIHVGGVAQLALLGGDPALAMRIGFVPFLTGDLLKVGLAAALILAAGPRVRSLL